MGHQGKVAIIPLILFHILLHFSRENELNTICSRYQQDVISYFYVIYYIFYIYMSNANIFITDPGICFEKFEDSLTLIATDAPIQNERNPQMCVQT